MSIARIPPASLQPSAAYTSLLIQLDNLSIRGRLTLLFHTVRTSQHLYTHEKAGATYLLIKECRQLNNQELVNQAAALLDSLGRSPTTTLGEAYKVLASHQLTAERLTREAPLPENPLKDLINRVSALIQCRRIQSCTGSAHFIAEANAFIAHLLANRPNEALPYHEDAFRIFEYLGLTQEARFHRRFCYLPER